MGIVGRIYALKSICLPPEDKAVAKKTPFNIATADYEPTKVFYRLKKQTRQAAHL